MSAMAIVQSPPWWVAPSFGLGGTVLGAVIALTASWIMTSKQMRRQDQISRREVYARLIERAVRLSERFGDMLPLTAEFDALRAEFDALRVSTRAVLAKPERESFVRADLVSMDADLGALGARVDSGIEAAREQEEAFLLAYYELTLYAAQPIRDGAAAVHQATSALYRAIVGRDVASIDIARHAVTNAIAEFTVLARADVRAQGTRAGVRVASRRIARLRGLGENSRGVTEPRT